IQARVSFARPENNLRHGHHDANFARRCAADDDGDWRTGRREKVRHETHEESIVSSQTYHLNAEHHGLTLAAALKRLLADHSWSQIRKLIASRRIQVNGNLCLDGQRKVAASDVIKLLETSL